MSAQVHSISEKRAAKMPQLQNPQLERAIIGLVLSWPDQLGVILEYAGVEDFTVPTHGRVFEAMCELAYEGQVPDVPLIYAKLGPDEPGNQWGGIAMLSEAVSMDLSQANAAAYAERLRSLTLRREIAQIGTNMAAEALENPHPQELLLAYQGNLDDLALKANRQHDDADLKPVGERLANEIENPNAPKPVPVPTGLKDIDSRVRLTPGSVAIVAAVTSVGKTMFALNIARNASYKHGCRGLYATLEVSKVLIFERLVSALTHVSYENVRARAFNEE
jgi:replicative DNA helicase